MTQRIILVKQYPDWQLMHVYEHAFCDALDDFLLKHDLLAGLDYYISANSFDNGVVEISIIAFSNKVVSLKNELFTIKITDYQVAMALKQVLVEKETQTNADLDDLAKQLQRIDELSWQEITKVGFLTSSKMSNYLRLIGSKMVARELSLDLIVPVDKLTPLFPFLANIIKINLANFLSKNIGAFYLDDEWNYEKDAIETLVTRIPANHELDIKIIRTELTIILERMLAKSDQIADFFQKSNYQTSVSAPDEVVVADRLGIFVGETGWQKIGTTENIKTLLHNIKLRIR